MHFRNQRKSVAIKQKLAKPCPYHSRVNSTGGATPRSHSVPDKNKSAKPGHYTTSKAEKQKIVFPKLLNNRLESIEPPSPRQVGYESYGGRVKTDINYYQDMRLSNEGWPVNSHLGRMFYARSDDVFYKAQERVQRIYTDQFYNVRRELQIINRIKQRYAVIQNIKEDKQKLKIALKKIKHRKVFIENSADQSENGNC